jgi:hypothetical protein
MLQPARGFSCTQRLAAQSASQAELYAAGKQHLCAMHSHVSLGSIQDMTAGMLRVYTVCNDAGAFRMVLLTCQLTRSQRVVATNNAMLQEITCLDGSLLLKELKKAMDMKYSSHFNAL